MTEVKFLSCLNAYARGQVRFVKSAWSAPDLDRFAAGAIFLIPAQAGIQDELRLDPRVRGGDELLTQRWTSTGILDCASTLCV
jgi:hypothetical protein